MEKKKKRTGIIAISALLCISILSFGIWGWARYSSILTGNGTATVAKWDFGSATTSTTVNLANASFNNVADKTIAPGTKGSFNVEVNAGTSNVTVNYTIKLSNFSNKPTNLKFYSDSSYKTVITPSNGVYSITGSIAYNATTKKVTVPIYWEWPYTTTTPANATNYTVNNVAITSNDEVDTIEGKTAGNCTFKITIEGVQAQPTAK